MVPCRRKSALSGAATRPSVANSGCVVAPYATAREIASDCAWIIRASSRSWWRTWRRFRRLNFGQRPLASTLFDEGVWQWGELECREVQSASVSCEGVSIEANDPPAVGEVNVAVDVHVAVQM